MVKVLDGEIDIFPLPCDKMKVLADGNSGIVFSGQDCSIDEVADPKAFFTASRPSYRRPK